MTYLICGSVVMDNILGHNGSFKDSILPEKINNLNVSFDLEEMRQERGGTGANILYNALKISQPAEAPCLFTHVGSDYQNNYANHFPDESIKYLQHIPDKKMAACFILNSNDGNQITSFYQGAMATSVDLNKFPINQFEDFLFSPENPKNTISLAQICIATAKKIYFDPGQCTPIFIQHYPEEFKTIIRNMHGLFVNEYEKDLIESFMGHELKDFYQYNKNLKFIVITKGSQGFTVYTRDSVNPLNGPCLSNVNVVDPTGCGDAFRAGFMKEYLSTGNAFYASTKGSIMASFAIENYGGQNHQISKASYHERQEQYTNEMKNFLADMITPKKIKKTL